MGSSGEDASWYFPANTDTDEDEHRVDLIGDHFYCTCRGFIHWRHCKHVERMERFMDTEPGTEIIERPSALPMLSRHNPADLALRLADMKANRHLTRAFFKEVMEEGVDYGIIPGTDKPTLFKPGAEGLLEFYGFAPTIKNVQETKDFDTGFLRVVVTIALIQRGTGEVVAEGIGECNTREARYFYRWMPEWELQKLPDLWAVKDSLKKETRSWKATARRKAGSAIFYRMENEDLFTLWNTVLKMAKKRALVDAALSATRSSGLFSQGQAALDEWIEGEFEDTTDDTKPTTPSAPPEAPGLRRGPGSDVQGTSPDSAPPAPATTGTAAAEQLAAEIDAAPIGQWWAMTRQSHFTRDFVMAECERLYPGREPKDLDAGEREGLWLAMTGPGVQPAAG